MSGGPIRILALGLVVGCGLQTSGVGDAGGDLRPEDRADVPPDAPSDEAEDGGPDAFDGDEDGTGPDGPADLPDAADVPWDAPHDEGPADVWPDGWLVGWERRVALTLDHGDIDEAMADFPVLVHLGSSVGREADDVTFVFDELPTVADRRKLAVTTSDGVSPCAVEVERWDAAAREAWLWVRVPAVLPDSDTVLYLYFDGRQADNDADVGDPGTAAGQRVWTNGYRLVLHMQDGADESQVLDSSPHGNLGTRPTAGNPHQVAEGRCGCALRWDGAGDNEFVRVEDAPSLDLGSAFTAEVWAAYEKGRTPNDYERMLTKKAAYTDLDGWEFSLESGLDRYLTTRGSSAAGTSGIANVVASWAAGGWHHVAVFYEGARARALVDGALQDDVAIRAVEDNGRPLLVGRYGGSVTHRWFGLLDEIRLSDRVRSDAWIRASCESGRDDLVGFGLEETRF
ncbi:MAG: LamG domain-containing protein [Deltaproteobacteria bacterium]|nr:LamG domain-containing protein [Deltaproteobacteria bacterium]